MNRILFYPVLIFISNKALKITTSNEIEYIFASHIRNVEYCMHMLHIGTHMKGANKCAINQLTRDVDFPYRQVYYVDKDCMYQVPWYETGLNVALDRYGIGVRQTH